jgi:hypothetical protein
MNKNKPIGSKTLSTIAGYTPARRPALKPELAPEPQAFEVTPDLSETQEVEVVSVEEALAGMITQVETVDEPTVAGDSPSDDDAQDVAESSDDEPTTSVSEEEEEEAACDDSGESDSDGDSSTQVEDTEPVDKDEDNDDEDEESK